MYGLTRSTITLIAAALAGLLVWVATQIHHGSKGGYWATWGLIAAAGLVMALSQLLGGWTKWGWPRISGHVLAWAFVPVAIVVLWILIYHEPSGGWFRDHIRRWSGDIGIKDLMGDFRDYLGVLAFGGGLVLGYSFDTTGPVEPVGRRRRVEAAPIPAEGERAPRRRGLLRRRDDDAAASRTAAPAPEPPPREAPPE
jgi:hypothetical protein